MAIRDRKEGLRASGGVTHAPGRLAGVARAAIAGGCAVALWVPLADGAGDRISYLLAAGLCAAGAIVSGARRQGPAPLYGAVRFALLVLGVTGAFVLLREPRALFPSHDPLASAPMGAMLWILATCSFFLFLPDGPLVTLTMAGALMLVSAHVDYGTLGLVVPFLFVFCAVLYGLATRYAAGEKPPEVALLVELAAVLSGVIALATLAVYLALPLVLPDIDLSRLARSWHDSQLAKSGRREPRPAPPVAADPRPDAPNVVSSNPGEPIDTGVGAPPPDLTLFRIQSELAHHFRLGTYSRFDGRRWSAPAHATPRRAGTLLAGSPVRLFSTSGAVHMQQVEVAAWTGTAIPAVYPAAALQGEGGVVHVGPDWGLTLDRPLRTGELLVVYSRPQVTPQAEESRQSLAEYLEVPAMLSNRVRNLAEELAARAPDRASLVRRDLEYLARSCRYRWTYGGPANVDSVDRFLFEERAGNCTVFASALAMLLRLQGVPARFASGFSGGEREPDGWLRVTARHGHAWVEAWNGERWATLEAVPSGSNAPDLARTEPQARRESSAPGGGAGATGSTPGPVAGAAVPAPEGPPSTAAAGRRARTPPANRSEAWLGALRERASGKAVRSARAHWPWALVLAALVAAGLAAGMDRLRLWSGWLLRLFNRRPDGLFDSRQERDFLNKLAAAGFVKEPWETLHEFLERLRQEGAAPESLAPLVDLSVRVRYSAVPPRPADIDLARHLLAALDREIRPTRKTGDTRPILKK